MGLPQGSRLSPDREWNGDPFNPHDSPMTIGVIIPFLKMRKLRLRKISSLHQVPACCRFKPRLVGFHSFHILPPGQEGEERVWLHVFQWRMMSVRHSSGLVGQPPLMFMMYIPNFPLLCFLFTLLHGCSKHKS